MKPYAIGSVACMMYLHKLKTVRMVVNNLSLYKLNAISIVTSNVCLHKLCY